MFKNKKAQVSIEMLLIIGAVILLAIVFIVFFISNLNRNVEISNKQSEGVDNIFDRFIKDYKEYNKVETFELKLNVDPDESVGKAIGGGSYKKGSVAIVEAIPSEINYVFDAWLDDEKNVLSSSLKYNLVMESNKTITARFKHKDEVETFSLKITVKPEKSGRVEPDIITYAKGTNVELSAKPSEEYVFKHWKDNSTEPPTINTSNPYNFTINKDTELVAVFEKKAPSGIPGEIGGPGGGGAETESP